MTLDELKERLSTEAKQTWEKIRESSAYIQVRDRYDNLTPLKQKLSLVAAGLLITGIILSIPMGYYSTANENIAEFEEKRSVIRELLKVSREASEIPNIPEPPPMETLKNLADTQLKNANLTPEQIKSVEVAGGDSALVPHNLTSGTLIVALQKLNIRQVLDLGYQLQSINPSVKMQDLSISASAENAHFFTATYKLIALAVPAPAAIEPEPAPTKGKRK